MGIKTWLHLVFDFQSQMILVTKLTCILTFEENSTTKRRVNYLLDIGDTMNHKKLNKFMIFAELKYLDNFEFWYILSNQFETKELNLCHTPWFLIPNVADPRYCKLWILKDQSIWLCNIKGLHKVVAFCNDIKKENKCLWQRLNLFPVNF